MIAGERARLVALAGHGGGTPMTKALDEIQRVFAQGPVAGLSDRQLLERFVAEGDGEAFAAIVERHGAMVLSVCRGALGARDSADAEDAFQATFLVLARRAGSFPLEGPLAGWLYRVARRVARQARIEATRRRARERLATGRRETVPPADPIQDELGSLIQQELAALPERYRTPILLCDLHGLTRDQAAQSIGCPPGTVAGRLARGRARLRDRLRRRGFDAAIPWTATLALPAADRLRLHLATTRVGLAARGGEAGSTAAAILAERAMHGFAAGRVAATLALLVALGAVGAGIVLVLKPDDDPSKKAEAMAVPQKARPSGTTLVSPVDPEDPRTADLFVGRVVDTEGKPIDGVSIYIVPRSLLQGDEAPKGPGPVRAVTATGGAFRFSAKDMTVSSLDGLPARRPGLLIASAPGHGPDWLTTWGETGTSFVSHSDPVRGASLTLTLPRGDVPIRGRLLTSDGLPLAGASVRLEGIDVPWKRDIDAHFARLKEAPPFLSPPSYERSLAAPSVLPNLTTETTTDGDGRFRLEGIGPERLARIRITRAGVADTRITVMTREAPDLPVDKTGAPDRGVIHGATFTLSLKRGRSISGVVRDAVSGAPLPGVWVGPGLSALSALETGRFPRTTDANGRFVIDGLSANLIETHYAAFSGGDRPRSEHVVVAVPGPGLPSFLARAVVNESGETVVNCPRGIPFHLRLLDEAGQPVEAEVTYSAISPNPAFRQRIEWIQSQAGTPLSRAARDPDGTYRGVALPGPGVVVARTPRSRGSRPAHVDPKAFFAPGRTDWTAQDLITTYGTHDTLSVATFYGGAWLDQHEYAAIVLVNPAEGSGTLELAATVVPDAPRQVNLVDPEGRPVADVQTSGLTYHPWDREPRLRAASFPITGLHPDRARRITFLKPERHLIGFLLARGDGDTPYTVRMQPWATLTGRIVDAEGRPRAGVGLLPDAHRKEATRNDPRVGVFPEVATGADGRFRVEPLVPGQSYDAFTYLNGGQAGGPAFERLVLAPGETRDLGDIRLAPPGPTSPPAGAPLVTPPSAAP